MELIKARSSSSIKWYWYLKNHIDYEIWPPASEYEHPVEKCWQHLIDQNGYVVLKVNYGPQVTATNLIRLGGPFPTLTAASMFLKIILGQKGISV